jgi:hypothetical protein
MNISERRALKPFKNRKETLLQLKNINRQFWSSSIMDSWIKSRIIDREGLNKSHLI